MFHLNGDYHSNSDNFVEATAIFGASFISIYLYTTLGLFVRGLLQVEYLFASTVYDTVFSQVVQNVFLGVLAIGVIPAVMLVIGFLWSVWSDRKQRTRPA